MQVHPVEPLARPALAAKTCPLSSAPPQPAQNPLVHVVVDAMELARGSSGPEVVSPAMQHWVQRRDQLLHVADAAPTRTGQLVDPLADVLHRFRRRPAVHEMPPRVALDAAALSHRASEKREALVPSSQIHQPRLLRVQLELKAR